MNLTSKFISSRININLDKLTEIAKKAASIGSEIIQINYKKIQKISSKGREGDLVTNVDLEVERKIKDYLLEETPKITILAEETGLTNKLSVKLMGLETLIISLLQ